MLALHKLFDLKDIAQALYEATPKSTEANKQHDDKLVVLEGLANSNIHIVGQERDGVILLTRVAYHKDTKKTFVDAFDVNKKSIVNLYKHNTTVDVVGATINADKSLLGFTIAVKGKQTSGSDIYESYIVETSLSSSSPSSSNSTPYALGSKGLPMHKIQFVYSQDDRKTAYVLCCTRAKNVILYEVRRRPLQAKAKDIF